MYKKSAHSPPIPGAFHPPYYLHFTRLRFPAAGLPKGRFFGRASSFPRPSVAPLLFPHPKNIFLHGERN
jgi:hypothetical protein